MCPVCLQTEIIQCLLQGSVLIISNRKNLAFETVLIHIFNLQKIRVVENRVMNLQYLAVLSLLLQKVSVLSNINAGGGYDLLTDRIDRRIGYLCKHLLKIIKQRLYLAGKHWKRCIGTHGCDRLISGLCHRQNGCLIFFEGITKCLLHSCSFLIGILRYLVIWNVKLCQCDKIAVKPLTIRLAGCIFLFQISIVDELSFHGIYQKHTPRS